MGQGRLSYRLKLDQCTEYRYTNATGGGILDQDISFATWTYLYGVQCRSPTTTSVLATFLEFLEFEQNVKNCPRLGVLRQSGTNGSWIVWNVSGPFQGLFRGFFFGDQSLISGFIFSGPGTDFNFFWFFKSLDFWVNPMTNEVDEVYRFQGYLFSWSIYIATWSIAGKYVSGIGQIVSRKT